MNADEFNNQISSVTAALDAAIAFINALWVAYDAKPALVGIDPATLQPAVDGLVAKAGELSNAVNARAVPA